MKNKIILILVVALIVCVSLLVWKWQPEKVIETVEVERRVEVVVHDTITVEQPAKIVYRTDTLFVEPAFVDSLYNALADSVKNGHIPQAYDSITFPTNDKLETWYSYPPKNSFRYLFVAAPDSIVYETIRITKIIDRTPKLAISVGPVIQQNGAENFRLGYGLGVGIKKWSLTANKVGSAWTFGARYQLRIK